MASALRPELKPGDGSKLCLTDGTAYLMIANAVNAQRVLIHGRLHAHGEHCAIGSFFAVNHNATLPWKIIDEVAAVNDSMPNVTERQRKIRVAKWLRWKLEQCGLVAPRKART